jgi:hypothetical protein
MRIACTIDQRRVGPVQVLDRHDHRRAGGERAEQARPRQRDLVGQRLGRELVERAVR